MVGVDQADYRQFPHWFAVAWFSQVGAIWWDSAHVEGSYWDSRCASPWCSRGMSLRSASFAPQWARPYLHLAFRSLPSFRHSWYRWFLCWHRFSSSFERVKPHIKPPAGLASGKTWDLKSNRFWSFSFLATTIACLCNCSNDLMTWSPSLQASCWPVITSGCDVIGVSATGSGKTLAFLVPAVNRLMQLPFGRRPAAACPGLLVLAPTRELADHWDLLNRSHPLILDTPQRRALKFWTDPMLNQGFKGD